VSQALVKQSITFVLSPISNGAEILPNVDQLSPTSKAMVECSDILVGIGGGGIGERGNACGQAQGKPVHFYPADMNHARAIQYAKKRDCHRPSHLGVEILICLENNTSFTLNSSTYTLSKLPWLGGMA